MKIIKIIFLIISVFSLFLSLGIFFVSDVEASNLLLNNFKYFFQNNKNDFYIYKNYEEGNDKNKQNNINDQQLFDNQNQIIFEDNSLNKEDSKNIEKKIDSKSIDSKNNEFIFSDKEKNNINIYSNKNDNIKDSNANLNNKNSKSNSSNVSNIKTTNSTKSKEDIKENKPNNNNLISTIYLGNFYTIQVASFKNFDNAIKLKNDLIKKKYFAFIIIKLVEGVYFYRVNIGIFYNKEEAIYFYKNKLKIDNNFKPFIIYYPKNL
jgi:cell division septation protein DedD